MDQSETSIKELRMFSLIKNIVTQYTHILEHKLLQPAQVLSLIIAANNTLVILEIKAEQKELELNRKVKCKLKH